jgi:glycosyltransferase involved in cell wall biosynthesis
MPTLALSMIVRDAERDLAACLESARGAVDEIVIADTGSTDKTIELARSLGARVFSIPWENDFARARNLSLAEVTADWVLSMDADERLDPAAPRRLPSLLANRKAAAYQVPIRNYVLSLNERIWDRPAKPNDSPIPEAKQYPAYVDHENVRLFRRDPDLYFVGRVHETVGIRILETGGVLGRADFLIHHFGLAVDPQTQNRKNLYYRDLSIQKVQEMPKSAQALFELGMVETSLEKALSRFELACELKPDYAEAWIFAGMMHHKLGHFQAALAAYTRGGKLAPANSMIAESLGDVYYDLGDFQQAEKEYRRTRKLGPARAGLESKLGLAQIRNGHSAEGLQRLQKAIARDPATGELHDRLITAYVWLRRPGDAAAAAEEKLSRTNANETDYLRAASIHAQIQNMPRAVELLKAGQSRFPQSEKLSAAVAETEPQHAKPR